MLLAKKVVSQLTSKFTKKDITEMKQLGMKPKQYIHYKGMWDKLLNELQKEINNG